MYPSRPRITWPDSGVKPRQSFPWVAVNVRGSLSTKAWQMRSISARIRATSAARPGGVVCGKVARGPASTRLRERTPATRFVRMILPFCAPLLIEDAAHREDDPASVFLVKVKYGGGRGIRTPGTLAGTVVFKTTAIDHSAI